MFSKKKKEFPPGTFIAKPIRILAILQLCISFTVLLSYAGYPFMGELYTIKSKKLLYESVIGNENAFDELPFSKRDAVLSRFHALQERTQTSFKEKLFRSLHILCFEVPPFEKAWLLFSIVIPILLLIKVEGATMAAWILPLIVFAYSTDNTLNGYSLKQLDPFPSEEQIVNFYLKEPLGDSLSEQKEQLLKGWRLYLINEWTNEDPSSDQSLFQEQAKKGEFYFNLARINALTDTTDRITFRQKRPPITLLGFIFWNLFFAVYVRKSNAKRLSVQ